MSNLNEHNNWFFQEAVELMLIPLTIIIFVFGLNSDILYNRLNPENNDATEKDYSKIATYIDLFDEEIRSLKNAKTEKTLIVKEKTNEKYNFLFIIDRTKSNVNPEFDKHTTNLKSKLKDCLHKTFPYTFNLQKRKAQNKQKYISIKELVTLSYFKELVGKENINSFCIAFYDGNENIDSTQYVKANDNTKKIWYETGTGNEFIISKIDENNVGTVKVKNQKTDFNKILELTAHTIKNKKNTIITLISDFYHESIELNDSLVRELKKNEEIKKIIFLKLPHNNSKKQIGYEIIKKLNEYFEYNQLSYKEIDITNYTDDKLESNRGKKIDDYFVSIKQAMYLSKINPSDIKFYYPNENWIGNKGAGRIVEIFFKDSINYAPKIQWKIARANILKENTDEIVYGGYYEEHNEKMTPSKFILNKWYDGFNANNKKIRFKLNDINENYQFHMNYDSKTVIRNIKPTKLMPRIISNIGKYSIYAFMVLFICFVTSHFWRNINYIYSRDKKTKVRYFILQLLFILICGLIIFFTFPKEFCKIGLIICTLHFFYLSLSFRYKKNHI